MLRRRERARRPVPGGDAVERREHHASPRGPGSTAAIDFPARHALLDHDPEARLVGVPPGRDLCAPFRREEAPLLQERLLALPRSSATTPMWAPIIRARRTLAGDGHVRCDRAQPRRRIGPPPATRSTRARPPWRPRAHTGWRPGCRGPGRCRGRSWRHSRARETVRWRCSRSAAGALISLTIGGQSNERSLGGQRPGGHRRCSRVRLAWGAHRQADAPARRLSGP